MITLNQVVGYFKEVASSVKFQIVSCITFGVALILVRIFLKENIELQIFLAILCLFSTCMLFCSLVEKIIDFLKKKKQNKLKKLNDKRGSLGIIHTFGDELPCLWKDADFEGLGWQILVVQRKKHAFLAEPCCYSCETNLLTKENSRGDGFYLECNDCKQTHDVGDIGAQRDIANSSLQGEVRRNPRNFFKFPWI